MFLVRKKAPTQEVQLDAKIEKTCADYVALTAGDGGYSKIEARDDFLRIMTDPRIKYIVVNLETRTVHIGTALVTLNYEGVRRRIGEFIISITREKSASVRFENIDAEPVRTANREGEAVLQERRRHPHMISSSYICTDGWCSSLLHIASGHISAAIAIYLDALYSYNVNSKYYPIESWPAMEE